MTWNDDRDCRLLALWGAQSVGEIAAELGTTRNAVIGRYHRLKKTDFRSIALKRERHRNYRGKLAAVRKAMMASALAEMDKAIAGGAARNDAIKDAVKDATCDAIGAHLGISKQRVSQIIHK